MNGPPFGQPQHPYHAPDPSYPPSPVHNFQLNGLFATTAVASDMMTGGIEFASMGALFAFSLFVAGVLFFVGVIIQRKAGDPLLLAVAKSACVSLLVAIPTPIPGFLVAAWGLGSAMKGHPHSPHDPGVN